VSINFGRPAQPAKTRLKAAASDAAELSDEMTRSEDAAEMVVSRRPADHYSCTLRAVVTNSILAGTVLMRVRRPHDRAFCGLAGALNDVGGRRVRREAPILLQSCLCCRS